MYGVQHRITWFKSPVTGPHERTVPVNRSKLLTATFLRTRSSLNKPPSIQMLKKGSSRSNKSIILSRGRVIVHTYSRFESLGYTPRSKSSLWSAQLSIRKLRSASNLGSAAVRSPCLTTKYSSCSWARASKAANTWRLVLIISLFSNKNHGKILSKVFTTPA